MSWEALKSAVTAVITANGNEEITGQIFQDLINGNLIPQLGAAKFKGIATPTTNPGTPSNDVFYLASTNGDYSNFGTTSLNNEIAVIQWVSDTWVKHRIIDNSVSMRYKKGSIMPFTGNVEIDTTAATPTISLTGRVFVSYNGGLYDAISTQPATIWDSFLSFTRLNIVLFNHTDKTFHVVDFTNVGSFNKEDHLLIGSIANPVSSSDNLTFFDIAGVCIVDGVRYINGVKQNLESEIDKIKEIQDISFQTFTGEFSIDTINKTFTANGNFWFNESAGFKSANVSQISVPWDTQGSATEVYNILFNPESNEFAIVRFSVSSYGSDWISVGSASNGRFIISGNYSVDGVAYINGIEDANNTLYENSFATVFGFNGGELVIDTDLKTVEVTGRLLISYNGSFYDVNTIQPQTAWDNQASINNLYHILLNKETKIISFVNYLRFSNYSSREHVLIGTFVNNEINIKGNCIVDGINYTNGIPDVNKSVTYNGQTDIQNLEYQTLGTDYSHIIFYGQSLSMGWEADAALTTTAVDGTFMIGDRVWIDKGNSRQAVLSPLVATDQGTVAESPAVSSAHVFKDLINKNHWKGEQTEVVSTNCGEGGRSIERLSKESTNGINYYDDSFMAALNLMSTIAVSASKSVSCPAIVFMQGEWNYLNRTGEGLTGTEDADFTKDGYKALLLTLKNNMQSDIMAVYGQTKKPLFFIYQVAGGYINRADMSVNMAQIEFAEENTDVILLNPTYGVTDYGGGHLTTNGYRWYGELIAKDLFQSIIKGRDSYNTKVKDIRMEGNKIYLDCSVFASPLVVDTYTVEEKTNYGFYVFDYSGEVNISKVEILNGTTIRLTLSRDLDINAYISYAGDPRSGTGNIRDSHEWLSKYDYADETALNPPSYTPLDIDGNNLYGKKYPCWNWLSAFYKTLN